MIKCVKQCDFNRFLASFWNILKKSHRNIFFVANWFLVGTLDIPEPPENLDWKGLFCGLGIAKEHCQLFPNLKAN